MSQVNINKTEALLTTATPDPVPDTLVLRDNAGNISVNVMTSNIAYTIAANGGGHIFVQSTTPTAVAIGDIWIL